MRGQNIQSCLVSCAYCGGVGRLAISGTKKIGRDSSPAIEFSIYCYSCKKTDCPIIMLDVLFHMLGYGTLDQETEESRAI